jgi:hypothetical protein
MYVSTAKRARLRQFRRNRAWADNRQAKNGGEEMSPYYLVWAALAVIALGVADMLVQSLWQVLRNRVAGRQGAAARPSAAGRRHVPAPKTARERKRPEEMWF